MSKVLSPFFLLVVTLLLVLLASTASANTNNNNKNEEEQLASGFFTNLNHKNNNNNNNKPLASSLIKKKNNKKKKSQNSNNNNVGSDDWSWSFPGSSGSWWWSSSSASDASSSDSSSSEGSSAYSAGSSFYELPQEWHNAGRMKLPFAHACSTFTLQGHARMYGGYYSQRVMVGNTSTYEVQSVLSQAIFDLEFPTTRQISNVSLPLPLQNITGTTSCSYNQDTGMTFVMGGNTKHFSSEAVFFFRDDLLDPVDVSLPFKVNRSSIAATVIEDELIDSPNTKEKAPTSDRISSISQDGKVQFSSISETKNKIMRNEKFVKEGNGDSNSSGTTTTTAAPSTTATPLFVPDAVIIGGEGVTSMYGLHSLDRTWRKMCDWDRPLCDCSVIPQPYTHFIMACNDCQSAVFTVYETNLTCYLWDMHHPVRGTSVTTSIGLTYLQSMRFGKFSVFAFRPVDYFEYIVLNLFDHEFQQWISVEPKKGLEPPRTDGALFSWLGRLQIAGGENIGLEAARELQERKSQHQQQASLLVASAESAELLGGGVDEEGAFYPPPKLSSDSEENKKLLRQLIQKKREEDHKFMNPLFLTERSTVASPYFNPINPDFTISGAIQDLSIVKIPIFALVPETKTTFTLGDEINIECPRNSYVIIATAPDCFRLVDNITAARCSSENTASMFLLTPIENAYICIAPGTCRIRSEKERVICENNTALDFPACSGKLGCCWDEETSVCYEYSDDLRMGAPYFYLAKPQPITISLPTPTPTTSPGGNSGNHKSDGTFLSTTTGKAVTFVAAGIVGITLIIAVILHCTGKNKESSGSAFCLHEFVSKRYEVIRELGRGGFGTVYLAIRKSDKKELALKVIACSNEDDVQSALMEFNLLRETKPHPGMMQILDIHCSWEDEEEKKKNKNGTKASSRSSTGFRSPGPSVNDVTNLYSPTKSNYDEQNEPLINNKNNNNKNTNGGAAAANESTTTPNHQGAKIEQQKFVCIVMEYYPNGDLAQFVAQSFEQGGGPAETWLWTVLARQLFSVLAHLHAQSPPIVHRDIKPENLLMGGRAGDKTYNRICITDFGLAAQYERTFMSTRAGSFHYLAPECWSHRYTASVDVWSAGCILYAAATGCVAPPAARVMFNDARHPSFPNEIREDLRNYSPDFANLVLSILKMDPNQRPTAQQLFETISKKCATLVKNGSDEDCTSNGSGGGSGSKKRGSSIHLTDSQKSNVSVQ